jgi:hypothetical protein
LLFTAKYVFGVLAGGENIRKPLLRGSATELTSRLWGVENTLKLQWTSDSQYTFVLKISFATTLYKMKREE